MHISRTMAGILSSSLTLSESNIIMMSETSDGVTLISFNGISVLFGKSGVGTPKGVEC